MIITIGMAQVLLISAPSGCTTSRTDEVSLALPDRDGVLSGFGGAFLRMVAPFGHRLRKKQREFTVGKFDSSMELAIESVSRVHSNLRNIAD